MSEEEKKAIEVLKLASISDLDKVNVEFIGQGFVQQAIKTLLQALEEKNKEIEELKRLMVYKNGYTAELEKDLFENCSNYVVPKSVIREKIKIYKSYGRICDGDYYVNNVEIKTLEELLEGKLKSEDNK